MKAELKNGKLVLTIDLDEEPTPSSSGKMLLYRYVQWSDLGVKQADHPLRATVTVGIKNPDFGKVPVTA